MATSTEVERIKAARKHHTCSWCGTRIDKDEPYSRYRYFDGGAAVTVKLHPECDDISNEVTLREGPIEFRPGDNPRGCDCGFDPTCARCEQPKK